MKQEVEEDIRIRRYLMGDLQQEEELLVEERLFLDSEYAQMLQAVEDDLIDDYLYGELPPEERSKFEKYFLSTPEREQALKVAEALKQYIAANSLTEPTPVAAAAQPPSTPKATFLERLRVALPAWRLPLAAAALLLITISALWLVFRALRTDDRPGPIQAQQPASEANEEARKPAQDSRPGPNPQSSTDAHQGQEQSAEKREKPATGAEQEQAQTASRNNQARGPAHPAKRVPPHLYSFMLIPGSVSRGDGDLASIELRSGAGTLNLQLVLLSGGDFPAYRATLFTADNRAVRNWTGLRSTVGESGKSVSIKVPTALLRQETYHVKLSGESSDGELKDISTYYFHVVK